MNCPHCSADNPPGAHLCRQCGAEFEVPDPLIGQEVLGRYRVVSLIGEGGMGRVYLAEQRVGTTIRKVAVKTLRPQLSADKQLARRFFREAETIVRLTHPNMIQFFDFGEIADGTLVIVMEFIEGRSLAQELLKGPMTTARADRIFAQVCGALAEAHGLGIVHRDLKPDNILLTERGGQRDFVKVLDFGIAKISHAEDDKNTKLTQQGMMVGTPPYMSPEQFGADSIDARSDIYSLGIIAYEMLSGKLPFMAQTPWEWASKHLTAEPEPLQINESAGVSQRRAQAIRKAMNKARDQRHQDVAELLADFTATGALAYTGTMVQPPSASGPRIPTPGYSSQPAAAPTPAAVHVPTPHQAPPSGALAPTPSPRVPTPAAQPGFGSNDDDDAPAVPQRTSPWLWVGGAGAIAAVAVVATVMVMSAGGNKAASVPAPPPPVAAATTLPSQPAEAAKPKEPEPPIPTLKAEPEAAPAPAATEENRPERRRRDRESVPARDLPREEPRPAASRSQPAPAEVEPAAVTPAPEPQTSSSAGRPVRVLVPSDLSERVAKANAMVATNVGGAVGLYQAAVRKYGEEAPGLPALKKNIARAGESHLRELMSSNRCAQAQAFYRALSGIDAAPAKEKFFGKACPAP